jgi:MoaA/NifB/PqqE/SkfB family radical SAM enzyme
MKIFKDELKLWRWYSDNKIVDMLPPHLDIELTNRCNLTCDHCPYHGKNAIFKQEPCDMHFPTFKKIINEAAEKNVRSVKLSYSGEPLLYERLGEAIEFAKSRGLQVNLNSNGLLLDRDKCVELIKAGLDVLIITDYGYTQLNLKLSILAVQKQVYKSETPYIVYKHPERRKSIFANESVPQSYYDYTTIKERFEPSEFECGFPWQRMLVLADGRVMACSCGMALIDSEMAYLGLADYQDLESLWKNYKIAFLRVCHENHDTHLIKMCRMCSYRDNFIRKEENER